MCRSIHKSHWLPPYCHHWQYFPHAFVAFVVVLVHTRDRPWVVLGDSTDRYCVVASTSRLTLRERHDHTLARIQPWGYCLWLLLFRFRVLVFFCLFFSWVW